MQSALPKGLMLLFPMTFMLPGCGLFVAEPPIVAAPSACSSLLPPEWREGVAGADFPLTSTIGDWIAFADAQTGQLDKANDRTSAAIGIIERCEERDRAAIKRARPKVLGVF